MAVLPTVVRFCYIKMLWIHGLTVMYLVEGRGEMAVLPAVTSVLLHNTTLDTSTDCSVDSIEWRGNGGPASSYCSTVKSEC